MKSLSQSLAATVVKIPGFHNASAIAAANGFRLALYGGASRELISFVLRHPVDPARHTIHWLDWHRAGSDLDLLLMCDETPADDVLLALRAQFPPSPFFPRVELHVAGIFFRRFPLEGNHYEAVSNIPISDRGIEWHPALRSLTARGVEQLNASEFDFALREFPAQSTYRDSRQLLRWIRLAVEHPHFRLTDSAAAALRQLSARDDIRQSPPIPTLARKIFQYSREPESTERLLRTLGLRDWVGVDLIPLPASGPNSAAPTLGEEKKVFLTAPLADAQNIFLGALWMENGQPISVTSVRPRPVLGRQSLELLLRADSRLGIDVSETPEGYRISTKGAIARIESPTVSIKKSLIEVFDTDNAPDWNYFAHHLKMHCINKVDR